MASDVNVMSWECESCSLTGLRTSLRCISFSRSCDANTPMRPSSLSKSLIRLLMIFGDRENSLP